MSIHCAVPLLGFCAFSGTGKTTLLTRLIPLLRAEGLRLGVIKHAHHDFDIDQPGKDSHRLRDSGAEQMLIASRHRMAFIRECRGPERKPRLAELLHCVDTSALDLVLVEGFKREPIPKIELHRAELGKPFLYPQDPHIIALATNADAVPEDAAGIPHLPLQEPKRIVEFILARVVSLPG